MTEALFNLPRRPGRPRKVDIAGRFTDAIHAAGHLRAEDVALMEVGRRLALELDAADDVKATATIASQLITVLDRLGLSPQARTRLGLDAAQEEVNPADELALIRGARRAAGVDAGP